ncbi:hypothetical protein NKR74_05090 [Bacillus sp. 3103sda1]|uniref:hypothetical protein n=1 Tax=Bacillus sp. 3103sda1 TaxID=2953808 RepID=UPI00209E753E|nr:hypothetical protein [Bacillus sp. 3103sda1]MCP1122721.1 hypothetical protein [Bacillus sp. 3103sda1]
MFIKQTLKITTLTSILLGTTFIISACSSDKNELAGTHWENHEWESDCRGSVTFSDDGKTGKLEFVRWDDKENGEVRDNANFTVDKKDNQYEFTLKHNDEKAIVNAKIIDGILQVGTKDLVCEYKETVKTD